MKRDLELCRTLLFLTEEMEGSPGRLALPEIEGFSRDQIGYHVYLLQDAGLLKAHDARSRDNQWGFYPSHLTWAGQEFLDAARNDTIWKKAKEQIMSTAGVVTVEALKLKLPVLVESLITLGAS